MTYVRGEDALRAIQSVNNISVDGRTLRASLGTTKYCSHFMKNQTCPKPDCMYLHEIGRFLTLLKGKFFFLLFYSFQVMKQLVSPKKKCNKANIQIMNDFYMSSFLFARTIKKEGNIPNTYFLIF